MKKFFAGIIVGAVAFSLTTVMASTWNVIPNPFPILVNGEKTDVDALNVNNTTYINFRDLGKATQLEVEFDENTKEIHISTVKRVDEKEVVAEEMSLDKAKGFFLTEYPNFSIEIAKKQGNTFYVEGVTNDKRAKMKFDLNGNVLLNEEFDRNNSRVGQ